MLDLNQLATLSESTERPVTRYEMLMILTMLDGDRPVQNIILDLRAKWGLDA